MDLAPYVEHLRRDLTVAAEAGGEEALALAKRLTASLESAARLALLDALSAAADEITRDLAPGSVEVRLRRRDPEFVVTSPVAPPFEGMSEDGSATAPPGASRASGASGAAGASGASATDARPSAQPEAEDGGTSRLSLRIPEHLKPRIEEAAGREGLSVNAWLVRAVSAALEPDGRGRRPDQRAGRQTAQQTGRRYTGWVR
ncbi:hypothetical protein [Streptosporangium carneum]|uniref:Toxin-antitoxin system HicB family antitoxin n=1 Tax=Streptosporangium carneum TaxID=47481 RepID=A0A9W6HYT2_9ACTN|nr:hypothetical protein [Streptosporangium carneum]GLK08129.1 hypothetical protein GCM10017600_15340 [Streptosporangium carneum]